jgi:tRNA(Ile)-lysidine synthetase, N-terminal domain
MSPPPAIQISRHLLRRHPVHLRYLVGVSGGRDSVALLHLLHSAGYRKLVVCHLNHELRGRASEGDARFVHALAKRLGFEAEIGSTDVRDLAARSKLSVETAGRAARLAFFVGIARRRRCSTIFLAHHADDLVETALLNLFRGASPGGIGAMREIASYQIGKRKLTIVRPLLSVWRRQIDLYIRQHGLKFREDATNAKLDSRRNRIRHRILPCIEKQLGRDVRMAIWRAAQIWMEEESFLNSLLSLERGSCELDVGFLRPMPVALQRRTIVRWLRERGITGVGFDVVENIRELADPENKTAKVNLPRGHHARRRAKKIFVE